jgi:hypothetical protein
MPRRSVLAASALVLSTGTAFTFGATAADAATCTIAVGNTQPHPGELVVVTGAGFATSTSTEPVLIDGTRRIGVAHIDAGGRFTNPVTVPADAVAGDHTISVNCGSSEVVSTALTVLAPGVAPARATSTPLAATAAAVDDGPDVDVAELAVLAAVATAFAAMLTARRRRSHRLLSPQ